MPETTYYTSCLRIQRVDGYVICLTELDKDLSILDSDIDITGGSTQEYLSAAGYTPTNMQSTSDNAVNNADVEGVLSSVGVQREDIIGGRYDFARLHIFLWDWKNNILIKKLGTGHWGEVTIKDGSYIAEFRSLSQQLQQKIGRTYNPECDEQLGGTRCQLNVANFTQSYIVSGISGDTIQVTTDLADILASKTVTASGTTTVFTDTAIGQADNYYNGYSIKFTSGNNSGEEAVILTQTAAGVITLISEVSNNIISGDGYNIYHNSSVDVVTDTTIGINAYAYGKLLFTNSNPNQDGNKNHNIHMEVKSSTVRTFNLFLPMPFEITIGDTLDVYYGCDKRLITCKDKFNDNNVNFQGFPYIPGVDQISKFGGQ